jgi:hypothetical protein
MVIIRESKRCRDRTVQARARRKALRVVDALKRVVFVPRKGW